MRKTKLIAAVSALSVLALAACGGDNGGNSGDDKKTAVTTDSGLEVAGDPGAKPTVEVPEGKAPKDLVVDVLEEGDGEEVKKGDWLVSDYLGQTWDVSGDEDPVFDNSWDRGAPVGFTVGKGQLIKGWDEALVGQKIGSRVALTVPPDMAYGEQKDHELEKDTLVFVVEILASTDDVAATASGAEADDIPNGLPAVTTKKNGQPKLNFDGKKEPKKSDATVVMEGDGAELGDGVIANMLLAPYPDGKGAQSTWADGAPQVIPSSQFGSLPGGLGEALENAKVGSRIVARISAEDNGQQGTAMVYVIDVIDTYTTAA